MKNKLLITICFLTVLTSSIPVYADDPFKSWNDENQENAWSVMSVTDWSKMQDSLMLKGIESNVHADVNNVVRSYEDKIREIIDDTADISVSDGLVELMLAIMQIMGGDYPPVDDPYNVKVWIDPLKENIDYIESTKIVLHKLDLAKRLHPEADKVSYYENSDELSAVVQSIMLGTRYAKENPKYSVDSAKTFYEANKAKFDKIGVVPKLTFASEVSAIFQTTNAFGGIGTAEGKAVVEYASQFIGNPYVYGGNSLTHGIDCSGFTQQIFGHFGYSLPRTSDQQAHSGIGISYNEHQAGDIIVYPGHVAILTGDGGIVHASNSAPYPRGGIKYTPNALYRDYITVRRILQ